MTSDGQGGRVNRKNCPYKISGKCCKNVILSSILCNNCTREKSGDQEESEEDTSWN
jgi:hypothetical protein